MIELIVGADENAGKRASRTEIIGGQGIFRCIRQHAARVCPTIAAIDATIDTRPVVGLGSARPRFKERRLIERCRPRRPRTPYATTTKTVAWWGGQIELVVH